MFLFGSDLSFQKKFFDECNGVDHTSVPRKVRTASKKRIRQLISPPLPISKRANHMSDGAETLRKYVNKSKLNLTHCSSSRCIKELEGPITKDEEEVAETLYALAGMIPDTGTLSESKINSQLQEVKSLNLPEPETSVIASGVVTAEQDVRTTSSQFSAEALKQFPDVAVSAGEAAKSKSFDDASQCDTSINTAQLEISLPVVASQANQQNTHKEKRNNGIAGSLLWPGLSAVGSSFSDILDSSPQFPITKFPAWFGSTGSKLQAQNAESCLPAVKDSQVPPDLRKSFKRCAAHVYISRLTKVLQTAARGDTVSLHPSQSSSPDGLKQETRIIQNSPTGKANDMHGIVSNGSIASTPEKNPTEVSNAILLHKRLLQDQQQASTTSGFNSLLKQNVDFLSLSTGSYVMKGTNGANIAGHNLEAPVTSHKHPTLHLLLPQNGYSSAPFHYHPATAAAQQVLLPPYLGGASICPSREATMALPRQMSQQNELQNAHFAAQYKFGVSTSQMRDWQNAGRQMPIFGPSQAQFAASSAMEALSSKYAPPLLNEQELMSISTARATSRIRGQYYSFPSGLEGSGHGLYPNNVPSLQLLCNDRR